MKILGQITCILKVFEMHSQNDFQNICTNIHTNLHTRESLLLGTLVTLAIIFICLTNLFFFFIFVLQIFNNLLEKMVFILAFIYILFIDHLYFFFSVFCLFVSFAHFSISVFVFVTLICSIL